MVSVSVSVSLIDPEHSRHPPPVGLFLTHERDLNKATKAASERSQNNESQSVWQFSNGRREEERGGAGATR